MSRRVVSVLLTGLFVAGCGPNTVVEAEVDATPPVACAGAGTRCYGSTYQACVNGTYETLAECSGAEICVADLGCAACSPGLNTCVGDAVHACNADGSVGAQVEVCDVGECSFGHCATGNGCSTAAELIYVVDQSYQLYSFDPQNGNTFTSLGTLACATTGGAASPYSMSVDRSARAWVLYTNGEIFHVTTDGEAVCTRSAWTPGTGGYTTFGMGFVTDALGSTTEKLYINHGDYAWIDPETLSVQTIGPQQGSHLHNPELTGTGNAELYAYFPDDPQVIVQIDKATGAEVSGRRWTMPGLTDQVAAWAFAHWGGDFYTFVTTSGTMGALTPQVWKLDPDTGVAEQILAGGGVPKIVGAGVSTCAPVEVD